MKKLYRSKEHRLVSGVFTGLGIYLGIDPTLLRLVFVLAAAFSGFIPGIIAYIVAVIIIPEEPAHKTEVQGEDDKKTTS